MHGAPSVNYPVGRSRYAERFLFALWLLGACCAGAACWRIDGLDWRRGALMLSIAMAAGAAWRGQRRQASAAVLGFDGQHWSLAARGGGTACARVAIDLQSLLLVRLTEHGRPACWLWLEQRAMPERWRDLRRALYSRAPQVPTAADSSHSAAARVHHPFS
jgi:hypothetical protein